MKFLAALVCVLAVATATPSGIAHGGFGYSSVTAHTAALAHHVPVAHHAALTAPVAVAHHAAIAHAAPVAVAHHAAIAAPVAHTAVSHSSITQHHHAAAPVVHHAAVAHAAPLVHHAAVAHAAPLVHHTAAVHAAPLVHHTAAVHAAPVAVAHHANYAAAPVTVAHHAAVAHAAPVAVAHHANYAVAHHANIAAAPVAVAHHAAPVAVAHHAAVHAPVAVAHHAAYAAPAAVAYSAPIAAVGIEKTQYHAQDVLGQASYGHAEAFQRHDAIQDAAGNKVGSYSWVAPDGQVVAGKYVADALGYRVHSNALPVGPAPIGETAEVVAARSAHYAAHVAAGSHRFRRGIAAIHTPALAYSAAIRSPFQYTAHTSPITLSHYVNHTPLHYGLY